MRFKKSIAIVALLALMIGQIALAHHSAVHIDHGFSQAQEMVISHDDHHHNSDNDHNHNQDHKKHECPECLLTKSYQTAFYNAPLSLFLAVENNNLILPKQSLIVSRSYYNPNSPRAPPVFLI